MMGVKHVFMDEVSMVGSGMLFVHKRLQEIMGSASDFGGLSVVFVGDAFQLKPVCDLLISKNNTTGYAPLATNLWQQNAEKFERTTVMGQDNGGQFAQLLNRTHEGNLTESDNDLLATRLTKIDSEEYDRLRNSLHFYLQNQRVDSHNLQTYLKAQTQKYDIRAIDCLVDSVSADVRSALLNRIPSFWMSTLQMVWQMERVAQWNVFKCHETRKPGVSFECSLKIMIMAKVHELWVEINIKLELILYGHLLYLRRANLQLAETTKLPERNFRYDQIQEKQFTDHKETLYQKLWGAIFVGTARVIWTQHCANVDCCLEDYITEGCGTWMWCCLEDCITEGCGMWMWLVSWERNTVGQQSLSAQHEFHELSDVPI